MLEATLYHIKSAGRTRKGDRSDTNRDYICNFEFTLQDGEHGFYAVADGSLSSKLGERASEVTVQTLAAAIRTSSPDTVALEALITNANQALFRARNGLTPEDSFVSSLVCGYLKSGTLHVAAAGNGAAYIIQNNRIQRLTESQKITALDDPGLDLGNASKGLLGLNGEKCYFRKSEARLLSGDTVVFCSDGLAERLDSVAILEIALAAVNPERVAAALLDKAAERGATDDTSVVVVSASRPETRQTRFIKGINYPSTVKAAKLCISLGLLVLLAAIIHFFHVGDTLAPVSPKGANSGARITGPISIAEKNNFDARNTSQAGLTLPLEIQSTPPGARVLVDGMEIPGVTPLHFQVSPSREITLEFRMEGYLNKMTHVTIPETGPLDAVSVTLQPVPGQMGGVQVTCSPACDDLFVDGQPAMGIVRPFSNTRINLPSGMHSLDAVRKGSSRNRQISISGNELVTANFVFNGGSANAMPAPANTRSAASGTGSREITPRRVTTPGVEVVKPSSGGAAAGGTLQKAKPAGADGGQDRPSYVTVKITSPQGELPGCRVMFFQGDRLAATGSSGTAVKLDPGSYMMIISRDGYTSQATQKYFGSGSQNVTVFMQPE